MAVSRHRMLILVVLMLAVAFAPQPAYRAQAQADPEPEMCEQMTRDIMTQVGVNCADTPVGEVCFASPEAAAQFTSEVRPSAFDEPGDAASLSALTRLTLDPFNAEAENWGVSTLSLQANLPTNFGSGARITAFGGVDVENGVGDDTLFAPLDEAVSTETSADTSLRAPILGDPSDAETLADIDAGTEVLADAISEDAGWVRVVVDETAGWIPAGAVDSVDRKDLPTYGQGGLTTLQAFYFRSHESAACGNLSSGLLIQGHEDYPIDLIVNDVPLRIESTVFLRTRLDASTGQLIMDIFVLFGLARINPAVETEVIVPPGFFLSVFFNYTPGDFGEDDPANTQPVINFTNVLPMTQALVDLFGFLLEIPRGVLFYIFELPIISQPSGVGGVRIRIRFNNGEAVAAAGALCEAGVLPEEICDILGF